MWLLEHFKRRVLLDNRGIFQFLPALISGGLAIREATRGDGESELEGLKLPDFQEDPDFRETQDFLKKLGTDILGGDIPDYFSPIGEVGGKEFEDVLAQGRAAITTSAEETAAATGRGRGGGLPSQVAKAVAPSETQARFGDFMRALEGRGFLFQQGRGITESVRGAGQSQQAQTNQFALNRSGLDFRKRAGIDAANAESDRLRGESIGDLIFKTAGGVAGALKTGTIEGGISGVFGGVDLGDIFKTDETKKTTETGVTAGDINLGKIGGTSDSALEDILDLTRKNGKRG